MAKQIGIIPLVGTLDGVNFYLRKGKPVARKAGGGFDGEKIKKSPLMVRVRENGSEFGHCSKVKKIFKDALFPFFKNHKDGDLHGKMMQLFLAVKDLDLVSKRGIRTVLQGLRTAEGKRLLKDFDFTAMSFPFIKAAYSVAPNAFLIDSFDSRALKFSSNSTHLELQFGIVYLNFATLKATLCQSDAVFIPKNETITNLSLTIDATGYENTIAVAVVSYRYVQEINGVYYDLNDGKSFGLKVVDVYGL